MNTKDEFIKFLIKNNIAFEDIFIEKFFDKWDYNCKKFSDLGVGDLDIVEYVMYFEIKYDCVISDELYEILANSNPNEFTKSFIRNQKLNELGI
jgi:hypothetical protein